MRDVQHLKKLNPTIAKFSYLALAVVLGGVLAVSLLLGVTSTQAARLNVASPAIAWYAPSVTAVPGEVATYTLRMRNTGSDEPGVLTVTLPNNLDFVSGHSGYNVNGHVITWEITSLGSTYVYYTVTARLTTTAQANILYEPLVPTATLNLGGVTASDLNGYGTGYRIVGPSYGEVKVTSIDDGANNALYDAVAGETITVTAYYTIPAGTIAYLVTPKLGLEDGMSVVSYTVSGGSAWQSVKVGKASALGLQINGTLVSFPPFTSTSGVAGPKVMSYTVVATRTQYTFAVPGTEIAQGKTLRFQQRMDWCKSASCDEETYFRAYDSQSIVAVRPDIRTTLSSEYLDSDSIGAGGNQIRYTIDNQNNSSGRATAYDVVVTATLEGPQALTYVASPAPSFTATVGNVQYITWTVPSPMAAGDTWQAVVTATLSSPWNIGDAVTLTTQTHQETYAGDHPGEGIYTTSATAGRNPASLLLYPGITLAEDSQPAGNSNVTMGDIVTYTVVYQIGANTHLETPHYEATLPKGFHYLAGTLSVEGITVTEMMTMANSTSPELEILYWKMASVDSGSSSKVITATYQARNTGVDLQGNLVFAASSEMKSSSRYADDSVQFYWGSAPVVLNPTTVRLRVYQPYLGDNFSTERSDTFGDVEIGTLNNPEFAINFRNDGRQSAYDVKLCDVLPEGLAYRSTTDYGGLTLTPPVGGSTGEICWFMDELPVGTYSIKYNVDVGPTAVPGIPLANAAFVKAYSSMPGDVVGERHYEAIGAVPPVAHCGDPGCLTILGLAVNKQASASEVAPGDFLTYTINYSDTSANYNYTNVVITDTYDASLTYLGATPAGTVDTNARQIVWNVGNLSDNSGQITLKMKVNSTVPDGTTAVTNTWQWKSDQTVQHELNVATPVEVAQLDVSLVGPENTAAGELFTYQVYYTNTGTTEEPVTLTLDYDGYLSYQSSSASPVAGTDNVFADTLPADGISKTFTINVLVKHPLPYNLDHITSTVQIESPGAVSKVDAVSIPLRRPTFVFLKSGPEEAPTVGNIMAYHFYITNTGDITATQLVVTDTLDPNTSFSAGTNWNNQGSYATYQVTSLSPGEGVKLDDLIVNVDKNAPVYINTAELGSYQTEGQQTQAKVWAKSIRTWINTTPDPTAFPGRVLTFTVHYQSPSIAVENALITHTLPASNHFIFLGHQDQPGQSDDCTSGWLFSQDGQQVVWSCDVLKTGRSGSLVVWGIIPTTAEGQVLTTKCESGNVSRSIPVRGADNSPLTMRIARPWLSVAKLVAPTHPVAPGDTVTYTLVYTNSGTDPAFNMRIEDQLPTGLTPTSASCADTCNTEITGNQVTWTFNEVPTDTNGHQAYVVAQVKPTTQPGTISNAAYTVQSDRLSTEETTAGAPAVFTVLQPSLTLTKTVTPTVTSGIGQAMVYTITYVNNGGGSLSNVVVTDTFPALFDYQAANPSPDYADTGNKVYAWHIGSLSQGQSGTIVITGKSYVSSGGSGMTNQAVGDSDQTEPTTSNEATSYYQCTPPHNLDFTYMPTSPEAGQVITFSGSAEGDEPLTYAWDFGDGEVAGQIVSYTFQISGTHVVTMTVHNSCGTGVDTITKTVTVTESSCRPLSNPQIAVSSPQLAGQPITFTGSVIGTAPIYAWAFGDGVTAQGSPTAHTYASAGTYTVLMTVTHSCADDVVTATKQVEVSAPGLAVSPAGLSSSAKVSDTEKLTETLTVSNTGSASLTWSLVITPSASWLSVALPGGAPGTAILPQVTAPQDHTTVEVYFDPTGLTKDTYTSNLVLTSNAGNKTVPVTFTITMEDQQGHSIYLPLVVRNK